MKIIDRILNLVCRRPCAENKGKEDGIKSLLMSAETVQALFDGAKTQTRRCVVREPSLSPPFAPGDIMWVRENSRMPKEAARFFLRVKDVCEERLQDVYPELFVKEGDDDGSALNEIGDESVREMARDVWNSTISKAALPCCGWDANPWVWVIGLELCEKPEGWCEGRKIPASRGPWRNSGQEKKRRKQHGAEEHADVSNIPQGA